MDPFYLCNKTLDLTTTAAGARACDTQGQACDAQGRACDTQGQSSWIRG